MLAFLELDSIFAAVKRGEISFVRYFLDQQKVEVNVLNPGGKDKDYHHLTLAGTHSPLHLAAELNHKQIVEALIVTGASPNFSNKKGQTPLHHAVEAGAKDALILLLEKGGKIDTRDESGTSLLHVAAKKGNVDIINLLIQKGAPINGQVG